MPKTRTQSIVFTAMMVFCMVFCMTAYTVALKFGGLSYQVLAIAIREMWLEYVIVYCLIFFVITKTSMKLARRIIDPAKNPPIFMILAIQCFTVCQIVPVITLFATFVHGGFTADWVTRWIQTWTLCFPMALCLQIFYVGPLVRSVFRLIFSEKKG